ncbi:hypothetical protein C8F01DRAFT_1081437 [Mycena amicta]|nr:hypothetical protein C8F01DRAFT_1081437 [Mycena amicta]
MVHAPGTSVPVAVASAAMWDCLVTTSRGQSARASPVDSKSTGAVGARLRSPDGIGLGTEGLTARDGRSGHADSRGRGVVAPAAKPAGKHGRGGEWGHAMPGLLHAPSGGHATDGGAVYDGLILCPDWKPWVTLAGVRPFLKRKLRWLGTHGLTAHDGHWGHAEQTGPGAHGPAAGSPEASTGGGVVGTLRAAPAYRSH